MLISINPTDVPAFARSGLDIRIDPHRGTEPGAAEVEAAQLAAKTDFSPYSLEAAPEAVEIDPNYTKRAGYQPGFLGEEVPLPDIGSEALGEPATNRDTGKPELKYHHFSIVMNASRRFAFFTAVNIDGSTTEDLGRDGDKWIFDPRIPEDEQVGEHLYARNDLDRGHLVRRLDPVWGSSSRQRLFAASDTFHFTNCSPQHARFNQNQRTWAGLENYLLSTAASEERRVSVFTGPVFSQSDPEYRGVRLPKQFWKVVAFIDSGGALAATAYLLSQRSLLSDLEAVIGFGPYRTFQVSVGKIEALTGLRFGPLSDRDVLAWRPDDQVEVTYFTNITLPPLRSAH